MREDTIVFAISKANWLDWEATLMKDMLTKQLMATYEQGSKAKWKGEAMKDDDGEDNNRQPKKMKPMWKMKRQFKIEDDFRWAMMLGLGALQTLH